MSRRWIHIRPNGNPDGALAGMLTASASPGNGQAFLSGPDEWNLHHEAAVS
jgi:hypothetical protein